MKRGEATIPLPGIDVPFHSRYLQGGVPSFRQVLLQKMDVNRVRRSLARLEQRYIPNVVAVPFEVTHDFVKVTIGVDFCHRLACVLVCVVCVWC